jgi:dihydrofolate reductase
MGRKTYESIGRPLKGRTNIVLSRNLFYPSAGIHVAESIEKAVQLAGQGDRSEAFIIGGAEIYRLAIPLADRIYLTRVSATLVGDARFPEFNEGEWDVLSSKAFLQSPENEFPFRIIEMIRKNK